MKIIIVGASGTIGRKVSADLRIDHEIIEVGSKSGDIRADITDEKSIRTIFETAGSFDALISVTGSGYFGPVKGMTGDNFRVGLNSKLLGQINLVLIGQEFINPKGSFTLTSGILSDDPVYASSNLAAVNAALNGFVIAASMELENDCRINVVSPGVVADSPHFFPHFPGHVPVTMDRVVAGYRKAVLGSINGQVVKVW